MVSQGDIIKWPLLFVFFPLKDLKITQFIISHGILILIADLQWTEYGSMFCHQVVIGWPRRPDLRNLRPAHLPRDHALSPASKAWSTASNTFWRTRMHRTSSATMSLLKMASVAPMLHQRLRGKMGEWETNFTFLPLLTMVRNKLDIYIREHLTIRLNCCTTENLNIKPFSDTYP